MFVSCLLHVVLGTRKQQKYLSPDVRKQLFSYLAIVGKSKSLKIIALGGGDDHVHILMAIPPKISIESAVLPLKYSSTTWLRQNFTFLRSFDWSSDFAAFSIGRSQLDSTLQYIENQEQYHQKKSFQEEYKDFLNYHHIPFDALSLFSE